MKNRFLLLLTVVFIIYSSALAVNANAFLNRIEGQIFTPDRLPVANAYVELINEVDSVFAQTKTKTNGRYTFVGMPGGRYIVKVLPLGTQYKEQTQEVYVQTMARGGSDFVYSDIYLVYDKRADTSSVENSAEAIFVQEIPSDAKKLYEDGVDDLKKNQDTGFAKLEQAIEKFPTYFNALSLLGEKYVSRGEYDKAYPYLLKAIDVNSRSSINFYRLGFTFYQLKQYKAAVEASKAAVTLVPESIDALLLYGTVLRINENFEDGEKILSKANTVAKGKNPEVHWQLALLYNRLNRNQAAIDELETFLKINPNSNDKPKIQALITKLKTAGNTPK